MFGAVKSLRLNLLEVILTNQFVSLFRQKTKIFVLPKFNKLFLYFKLKLKHLIQIEKQIKTVELKTNSNSQNLKQKKLYNCSRLSQKSRENQSDLNSNASYVIESQC